MQTDSVEDVAHDRACYRATAVVVSIVMMPTSLTMMTAAALLSLFLFRDLLQKAAKGPRC